jgi:hypothetical protein
MPYSKSGKGSEAEIAQRVKAAQANAKHGAYAFQARGDDALTPTGRSRHSELRELVQSREGIIELLQQRAADAVMVCEMAISYVAKQTQDGHTLADIPVMRTLPVYQNSAVRALHTLAEMMPKDSVPASAELEKIRRVIEEHDKQVIE